MKKTSVFALICTALAVVLSACGGGYAASEPEYAAEPMMVVPSFDERAMTEAPAPMMAEEGYAAQDSVGGGAVNSTAALQDRLVIMNADLSIVVPDPQTKIDEIAAMADEMGGFVVSMNVYQTYSPTNEIVPEGRISIRVPADFLDRALNQIKSDAIEVRTENRSGEDVTQQYVDLESQLRSLEAAEEELTEIMQNSTDTQDVLDVFNQLEYYRQQIEIVKGQMQYFEQASAYSLINVTVIAEETIQPIEIAGWEPKGVVRDAIQSLINFLQNFVTFLIWLVLFVLPMLLLIFGPIALIIWGIIAAVKRSRRKSQAKA